MTRRTWNRTCRVVAFLACLVALGTLIVGTFVFGSVQWSLLALGMVALSFIVLAMFEAEAFELRARQEAAATTWRCSCGAEFKSAGGKIVGGTCPKGRDPCPLELVA